MEEKTERSESGHHHHHHHHHRKKRTWKDKVRHFLKKYKKECQISAVVGCALLVLVVFMALGNRQTSAGPAPQETQNQTDEGYINVKLPAFFEPVPLNNDAVTEYLASDISVKVYAVKEKYDYDRFDLGLPVELDVNLGKLPDTVSVQQCQLELAEGDSFENSVFFDLSDGNTVWLDNLKTGSKYSYRAHFTLADGNVLTYGGTFETAAGPRMMTIEGIYNVRDIGGWDTVAGFRVKQGLLYRGTEVDGAVEPDFKLTDTGVNTMLRELGIQMDLDLRAEEDQVPGSYILGSNVTHKYFNAAGYEQIFEPYGQGVTRRIFSELANPNNYPIYLHCTYGCDRTGSICYLLSAMLGVSENDLIRDYELSGLYFGAIQRENIQKLYDGLQSYEGFTIQEKTISFLRAIGVTDEEIAAIQYIFLG